MTNVTISAMGHTYLSGASNGIRHGRGFTIVELLIVVVVIAVLSTISIAAYNGITERARNSQMLAAFDVYDKAIQMYYIQTSTYPSSINGAMDTICIGGGYSANAEFSVNECQRINGATTATTSTSFDTSLTTVIKNTPSLNPATVYSGPHPLGTVSVRGIIYNGGQDTPSSYVATLLYYLKGNQTCGRGDAVSITVGGSQMTQCAVRYRNNQKIPVTAAI